MSHFELVKHLRNRNVNFPPTHLQVPLAGDCPDAKQAVCSVLEMMGYHFTDLGPLRRARDIENIPLYLFLNWRRPLAVSTRNLSVVTLKSITIHYFI